MWVTIKQGGYRDYHYDKPHLAEWLDELRESGEDLVMVRVVRYQRHEVKESTDAQTWLRHRSAF